MACRSSERPLVRGMVSEFRSSPTSLTLTELTSPVVTVLSSGNPLPAPTVIGTGGRIPPSTVIEDDANGNVEAAGVLFDPAEDGLDFYESLEGMLVQMNDLVATSFTFTNFGEIFVVGDNGANATTITPRGGLVIGPGDLNPERIVIDDEWFKTGPPAMPVVNVGGTFPGAHVGIMDWAFGEYRIQLRSQPVVGSTSSSLPNGAGHERAPAAWGVPAEPIDFGTASLLPPPNPPTNGDQCGDQNAKSSVPCRKVINITC
jgi:uncharacterized protein